MVATRVLARKVLRDLWRAKGSFAAATVVVTLGVMLLGASYSSYQNLLSSYLHSYEVLHFADFVASVNLPPADLPDVVRAVPGVQRVTPRLVGDLPAVPPDGRTRGVGARIISVPVPEHPAVNDIMVYEGSYIPSPGSNAVLLESSFAEHYGLRPGDSVEVVSGGERVALPISGLVKTAEYILPVRSAQHLLPSPRSFAILYAAQANAERLLDAPQPFNELAVTVTSPELRAEVIGALRKLAGDGVVTDVVLQEDQASNAALRLDLEGFRETAVFFPVVFFGAAAFSLYVMLGRMVRAQTPVIGLLRAIGYGPGAIARQFLGFALVVGAIGAALGSLFGFLAGGAMTAVYTGFINVPVVKIEPEWPAIIAGAAAGMLVCLAAGLIPAVRAARMAPAMAMRGDSSSGQVRAVRFGARLPTALRLGLRNVARNPGRSSVTASVVAVAAAVVVVAIGFMDSMNDLMDHEFEQAYRYDAMVYFNQPVPASVVPVVASMQGVTGAEPVLQVPVEVSHGEESFATTLLAVPSDGSMLTVYDLDRAPATLGDNLAVGAGLGDRLGLAPGDQVELVTPLGRTVVAVDGFVGGAIGSLLYARLDRAQEILGMPDLVSAVAVTIEPAATDAVMSKLAALPFTEQVEVPQELRESMDELLGLALAFIGLMIVLAALLAFAVVFNTVTVGVLERRRELATMRMIGVGLRRLTAIVTIENLLIGIPGILLGLVAGRLLAIPVTQMFNSELFFIDQVVVQPLNIALVGIGLLAVVLISQFPGIRHISRMDLADVARERAG